MLITQTPECDDDVVYMHQSSENDKTHLFHGVLPKHVWKNWHQVHITSAIVHLNGLPATLRNTPTGVTWQDHDSLCIIPE